MNECCHPHPVQKRGLGIDYVLYGSLLLIFLSQLLDLAHVPFAGFSAFASTQREILRDMSWGLALGILSVGLINKVPREYFTALMGQGYSFRDIFKAALAGVALDMCNHGILVISGKLYERGLSLPQVMAFLIASPWNSLSLTFILISLIGWQWTLAFTLASLLIAVLSGLAARHLICKGVLPANPHSIAIPENFDLKADIRSRWKAFRFSGHWVRDVLLDGWHDSRMILRWIVFGAVIASAMHAFIPVSLFSTWFGPSLFGLLVTLVFTTLLEVCSEGSVPISAEILKTAHAPGNSFAFLMAGVSTDYTEILVVREFTKSWKIALFIPLVTVPQILVLGVLMNGW